MKKAPMSKGIDNKNIENQKKEEAGRKKRQKIKAFKKVKKSYRINILFKGESYSKGSTEGALPPLSLHNRGSLQWSEA
ncbi:hypothetical protein ACX0G9_20580 [Flavitalea flava]